MLGTSLPKNFILTRQHIDVYLNLLLQIDDVAISEQHMILTQIFNYYVNELELDSSSWFNHHSKKNYQCRNGVT